MKVVIQCAGQKKRCAGRFKSPSGEEVQFVARPLLCGPPCASSVRYCWVGEQISPGSLTWRKALVNYNDEYNRTGENPYGLSKAAELYRPSVYRQLVKALGWEAVFILSAGWGLIRSDFLTPDYNITFSRQKKIPLWARREKRLDPLEDLNQLDAAATSPDEPIHFFGGRDYLPLLHSLTRRNLAAKIIVHYKGNQPSHEGFINYEPFSCERNQNWHYEAVKAFLRSRETAPTSCGFEPVVVRQGVTAVSGH